MPVTATRQKGHWHERLWRRVDEAAVSAFYVGAGQGMAEVGQTVRLSKPYKGRKQGSYEAGHEFRVSWTGDGKYGPRAKLEDTAGNVLWVDQTDERLIPVDPREAAEDHFKKLVGLDVDEDLPSYEALDRSLRVKAEKLAEYGWKGWYGSISAPGWVTIL